MTVVERACTYDNPITMCRERWCDGKMMYSVTFELICHRLDYRKHLGMDLVMFSSRPWEPGKILGNATALTTTPLPEGQGAEGQSGA